MLKSLLCLQSYECALRFFIKNVTIAFLLQPGRNNPVVDLWLVDIGALVSGARDTVTRLPPPKQVAAIDHYFSAVGWGNENSVSVIWMNRHQVRTIMNSLRIHCLSKGQWINNRSRVSQQGSSSLQGSIGRGRMAFHTNEFLIFFHFVLTKSFRHFFQFIAFLFVFVQFYSCGCRDNMQMNL